MIEFTKQWVINIVALVLFIVMFEMLLPTGKMKKYINLVTGTILIIAIISPLAGFFGKNVDITALQATNSDKLDKLQVENESKILENQQMKQIVEVYRDKIIEELEQNAEEVKGVKQANADVIFNEDYNSPNFGEIKRAYLKITAETDVAAVRDDKPVDSSANKAVEATQGGSSEKTSAGAAEVDSSIKVDISEEQSSSVKPVDQIRKVNIGEATNKLGLEEKCDPKLQKLLEDRISAVFGISSDNIVISQVNKQQK